MYKLIVSLFVIVCAVSVHAQQSVEKRYEIPDAKFSIVLPAAPGKPRVETADTPNGRFKITELTVDVQKAGYNFVIAEGPDDKFLKSIHDQEQTEFIETVKQNGGTVLGNREIKVGDLPGREITARMDTLMVVKRFYYVPQRSFTVTIAYSTFRTAVEVGKYVTKVHDSFQLIQ